MNIRRAVFRKRPAYRLMVILALLAIVNSACDPWGDVSSTDTHGSIRLSIRNPVQATHGVSAQDVSEPDNLQIVEYVVSGSLTSAVGFTQSFEVATGQTVVEAEIGDLAVGEWSFVVQALNSDGVAIYSGGTNQPVSIRAGEATALEIVVDPVNGTGDLVVDVRWAAGAIQAGQVLASLSPGLGGGEDDAVDLEFIQAPDSEDFTGYRAEGEFPAGYHILIIDIQDEEGNSLVHTTPPSPVVVRVLANLETSVLITLDVGSVEFDIVVNPQTPLEIEFVPTVPPEISIEEEFTVTAAVSGGSSDLYTYRWFVNGAPRPLETSEEFTLVGATLGIGSHNVGVIVSDGTVLGSRSASLVVVE